MSSLSVRTSVSIPVFWKLSKTFNHNLRCKMYPVKDPNQLLPPVEVKGMVKLDREKFCKQIVVPWIEVNEKKVGGVMDILKKYVLKLIRFKSLRPAYELLDGEEVLTEFLASINTCQTKRVFLNPVMVGTLDDIVKVDKLQKQGVIGDLKFSRITINYDNWKTDEILKAILPDESMASYSIIGHIVHVNLRDHLLPYKTVIGEILLDKVNGAKTVVNKTDIIDSTYRNFKMEVLCGAVNLITRTKENGCTYELDFSAVYWNPRLSTEHERIVSKLSKGDILYDVFSGVGPFAIPVAKKQCFVLANDLNPESYKWLNVNCKLNKVQNLIRTFNMDGEAFIETIIKADMLKRLKTHDMKNSSVHITMNLPASAVSFLPSFHGLLSNATVHNDKILPFIHVYCFVSGDDVELLAKKEVENSLGCNLDGRDVEVVFVRNVSPNKDMMRVSLKLPHDLLFKKRIESQRKECKATNEPSAKRICLSAEGSGTSS